MSCINFGQIGLLTMKLAALERIEIDVHFFFVSIDPILFKHTSYKEMHKIFDEFEI